MWDVYSEGPGEEGVVRRRNLSGRGEELKMSGGAHEIGEAPAEKLNGMRRNEKAEVLEGAERSKGRKAQGVQSTHLHVYTHTSKISHGFGWRIHCGVEVTELSINKQLTLSLRELRAPPG